LSQPDKAEKVQRLCMRRGFFWPAYEIYGGVAGLLTWGPLGVILKNKIKDLWRRYFVYKHGFVEIDSPNIAPYIVFKASGHVDSFKDIMVSCLSCGNKYRADTLLSEHGIEISEALKPSEIEKIIQDNNVRCPQCGGELGEATYFMTMFQTTIGPYTEAKGFLRPETAQGMFTEFKRVYEAMRRRFPIGIAQIGRGFRNEISPRQGPIRLREFDMMELEMFIDPSDPVCPYIDQYREEKLNLLHEALIRVGKTEGYETMSVQEALDKKIIVNEWMAYFMVLAKKFMEKLGIPAEKQRFREKLEGERAHYATQTFDQEVYLSRWGWVEVSGHAYRGDYDLQAHIKHSGMDLYVDKKLKVPKKVKEVSIVPKADEIKRKFGEKIRDIMKALHRDDTWKNELLEKGYTEIAGVKLGKNFFDIKESVKDVYVEKLVPHVVEPSFGLDRIAYAVLEYSYREVNGRIVLSLPIPVRVYDCAVFPLVSEEKLIKEAIDIKHRLESKGFMILYDDKDSIGRRYARVDEIGIPVAITIDKETLENDTVTVRDRDTWKQYRISKYEVDVFLSTLFTTESFEVTVKKLGLENKIVMPK